MLWDQLHEDSKINIVDRLSRHLDKGVPSKLHLLIFSRSRNGFLPNRVIHIDDSDVVKSGG